MVFSLSSFPTDWTPYELSGYRFSLSCTPSSSRIGCSSRRYSSYWPLFSTLALMPGKGDSRLVTRLELYHGAVVVGDLPSNILTAVGKSLTLRAAFRAAMMTEGEGTRSYAKALLRLRCSSKTSWTWSNSFSYLQNKEKSILVKENGPMCPDRRLFFCGSLSGFSCKPRVHCQAHPHRVPADHPFKKKLPYLAVNSSKLSSWCGSWSASFLLLVEKAQATGLTGAAWKPVMARRR